MNTIRNLHLNQSNDCFRSEKSSVPFTKEIPVHYDKKASVPSTKKTHVHYDKKASVPSTKEIHVHYDKKPSVKPAPHISDFGEKESRDTILISTVIGEGQAFTDSTLNDSSHVINKTLTECETISAINLIRFKNRFHSIPLFFEKNVIINDKMIKQADQLAWLLFGLATQVFKIPLNTIHLFRDINGGLYIYNDYCFLYYKILSF
jgi:hypothetical protein